MSKTWIAIAAALGITAGAAGAATVHRLAVSQTTGSLGAVTYLQNSPTGSALQGEVNTSPNTSIRYPIGVFGEYDASSSTFGIGVAGISTSGYAVGAEALGANPTLIALPGGSGDGIDAYANASGAAPAVRAEAQGTGDAVQGIADKTGVGGYFSSATGSMALAGIASASNAYAGYFNSAKGVGLSAISQAPSSYAIEAFSGSGAIGLLGDGASAVFGFGGSNATSGVIASVSADANSPEFVGYAHNGGSPAASFYVEGNTADRSGRAALPYSSDVQLSGDLYVYGTVYQDCESFPADANTACSGGSASTSIAHSAAGADVRMYGTRRGAPAVEDDGTAHLVDGRAYVRLDPAFAATMSRDRRYRVYVTPAGDSRGLFVTARSLQGFEVRENQGGRSTTDFDYRIVAAPFGDRGERLTVVPPKTPQVAALRASVASDLARLRRDRAVLASFAGHAATAVRAKPHDLLSAAR